MLTIEKIDTNSKAQANQFLRFPYRMYAQEPNWVPPLLIDMETKINRKKHPYYEHSDADFFLATQDGMEVGRIAVLENKYFNAYHKLIGQFYLFECIDDQAVANARVRLLFA